MAQASKKEVEDNAQMEMDLLLNETKDPVSGNTAPVGALPSEVRDDIDIRVSENEYVIPAYAVRYFGEDFFDELLGSAKEGWERIKEGDELPFRDDELEVESDDDNELKEGYAEGGNIPGTEVPLPVGGGYGRYGGTGAVYTGFESRTFVDPDTDREIVIFFFNGRPMSRIPEGFRPKGETVVEEQQQVQRERDDDDDARAARPEEPTYLNTPVDKWTDEMYAAYAKAKPMGMLEKGFIGFVGNIIAGPIGALGLTKLAEKAEKQQAAAVQSSLGLKMNDPSLTQAQADIYSSAVQKASVFQFGTLSPFSTDAKGKSNAIAGAGMVFSDKTAADNYYAGLAAASDAGITTGYDDPIFAGGAATFENPDTGQVGIPSSSNNDGPSAAQIAAQNYEEFYGGSAGPGGGGSGVGGTYEGPMKKNVSSEPTLTTTEKYERDQARESASGDRIDDQRREQRIRDIVSGAIQPKNIDEKREFDNVISAAAG